MAALTMLYGNLAALPQDNFKRLLAYSSIGHAGYLLVAVASVSATTASLGSAGVAVAFYLAGYLLMTLLSFLVLIVVAKHSRGDDILHFNGLAKRSPFLAFGMLAAMLSLAGIPFTAGFIGKIPRLRRRRAGRQILARWHRHPHRRRHVLAGARRRHAHHHRPAHPHRDRWPDPRDLRLRHLPPAHPPPVGKQAAAAATAGPHGAALIPKRLL